MNFLRRGANLFRKASPIVNKLFQQTRDLASQARPFAVNLLGQGRDLASEVSPFLGKASNFLNEASILGGKIASNPELQNINSPFLQKGLGHLNNASSYAGQASGLATRASNFTNEASYNNGSHEANLTDALQRAKAIHKEAQSIYR